MLTLGHNDSLLYRVQKELVDVTLTPGIPPPR